MTYRFREAREKAGLSTLEVAKRIGVSQPAVTNWDNGTKSPSIDTLCKLADLYCVSTDYLLGRDEPVESIPRKEDIIATETLRALNGKPVWDENKGWGIVNGVQDYVIFMDGTKSPSIDTLCKLADLYCVSTDYLLGRDEQVESIPRKEDIIATETLRALNGKPVWDENRGWGIVNGIQDYVIFMDSSKIVLAEAMNLRAMTPAYSMGYSPAAKPISHEDLGKYKSIWVKPITPDSFLQDELTGWYEVHDFYVQNQYGTRFLFDTYGTRWLAFEMEF